jgi:putative ABC transport system ATP-binding protein
MSDAVVALERISKIYGHGDTEVRALDDVDVRIDAGEFVAIMGSSGSGKSTCMNIIGCLDVPSAGRYEFCGIDVSDLDRDRQALLRRHHIGFVFQGFNLLPRTTALENVELPLIYRRMPRAERRQRARDALAQVGLAGRENHTPAQLSGGQQQRVAVARALVAQPSLLLADEPTGNLDSARTIELMELLVVLNRSEGLTIAMVTHESETAAFAHRIIEFRDGRVASGRRPRRSAA